MHNQYNHTGTIIVSILPGKHCQPFWFAQYPQKRMERDKVYEKKTKTIKNQKKTIHEQET